MRIVFVENCWVIFEKVQTKEKQVNFKYEKVWWEPVINMFTCTERKDQAKQMYNWGLASISVSITARSNYGWIMQHQKYHAKWFDGPQPTQAIDAIQAERGYDEGDTDKGGI